MLFFSYLFAVEDVDSRIGAVSFFNRGAHFVLGKQLLLCE